MQVPSPPPAGAAGIAGTGRAQRHGSDAETATKQAGDQTRAASPAAGNDQDVLALQRGAGAEDSGGNGNAGYQQSERSDEEAPQDPASEGEESAFCEPRAGGIDFTA